MTKHNYDIVVVGTENAARSTAIRANEEGLKVLMVEIHSLPMVQSDWPIMIKTALINILNENQRENITSYAATLGKFNRLKLQRKRTAQPIISFRMKLKIMWAKSLETIKNHTSEFSGVLWISRHMKQSLRQYCAGATVILKLLEQEKTTGITNCEEP